MPIRKLRLSRLEEAERLVCLQQLRAEGHDVEIPEELQEHSRALDIHIGPPEENIIRQLPNGGIGCAVWARLIARRTGVILEDFGLAAAWDPDLIPLSPGKKDLYSFARGFDFTREEVLNHRIEKPLRFHHRGYLAEGWLLALGQEPIPDTYRHGMTARLEVRLTDQFGGHHFAQADAFVERSVHQKAPVLRPVKFPGLLEPLVPEMSSADERSGNVTARIKDKVPAGAPAIRGPQEQDLVEAF
ncbi:MAG TPA: hypothetical protein VG122_12680 [Gemmata sp.]|jgi:hypothetical protein|nr:hypothetical protein [Gemmata sp.]